MRSSADRIRVTAQLIRASDGFHLWSQNYDRDVDDMIGIQEDLAVNIANALETSMDPQALAEMARVGTASVDAYREYLRGVQLVLDAFNMSYGAEKQRAAYEHFERAGPSTRVLPTHIFRRQITGSSNSRLHGSIRAPRG